MNQQKLSQSKIRIAGLKYQPDEQQAILDAYAANNTPESRNAFEKMYRSLAIKDKLDTYELFAERQIYSAELCKLFPNDAAFVMAQRDQKVKNILMERLTHDYLSDDNFAGQFQKEITHRIDDFKKQKIIYESGVTGQKRGFYYQHLVTDYRDLTDHINQKINEKQNGREQ